MRATFGQFFVALFGFGQFFVASFGCDKVVVDVVVAVVVVNAAFVQFFVAILGYSKVVVAFVAEGVRRSFR